MKTIFKISLGTKVEYVYKAQALIQDYVLFTFFPYEPCGVSILSAIAILTLNFNFKFLNI